jgi:hypothetical protein
MFGETENVLDGIRRQPCVDEFAEPTYTRDERGLIGLLSFEPYHPAAGFTGMCNILRKPRWTGKYCTLTRPISENLTFALAARVTRPLPSATVMRTAVNGPYRSIWFIALRKGSSESRMRPR